MTRRNKELMVHVPDGYEIFNRKGARARLNKLNSAASAEPELCPECGHPKKGNGEGGCAVEGCKCEYATPLRPAPKPASLNP